MTHAGVLNELKTISPETYTGVFKLGSELEVWAGQSVGKRCLTPLSLFLSLSHSLFSLTHTPSSFSLSLPLLSLSLTPSLSLPLSHSLFSLSVSVHTGGRPPASPLLSCSFFKLFFPCLSFSFSSNWGRSSRSGGDSPLARGVYHPLSLALSLIHSHFSLSLSLSLLSLTLSLFLSLSFSLSIYLSLSVFLSLARARVCFLFLSPSRAPARARAHPLFFFPFPFLFLSLPLLCSISRLLKIIGLFCKRAL